MMRLMTKPSWRVCCLSLLILAGILATGCGEARNDEQQSAFEQQIRKIAKLLDYNDGIRIEQVQVNGAPANSAILSRVDWTFKTMDQRGWYVPPARGVSPEQHEAAVHKLMKPGDELTRYYDHIQIWALAKPVKGGFLDKRCLAPTTLPHRGERHLLFLGEERGLKWYGYVTLGQFVSVEKGLSLRGEDIVPILVRDNYAELIGAIGPPALAAIDKAITDRLPQRADLVKGMRRSQDEAVTKWLVHLLTSRDHDVAQAARSALLMEARKEATDFYVRWLAEGAGKRSVESELRVCRKLKARAAAASLPKVLAAPASLDEYRLALEMSHEFAGRPAVPATLLAAEKEILESGYNNRTEPEQMAIVERAVHTILTAGDPEDAAAIGMSMAVFTSKGGPGKIRVAGMQILRDLPGGEGKRLAKLLATTNRQEYRAMEIQDVAAEVGE
jgi:hypothetical protein